MQQWKLRYQFYAIRALSRDEAIRKAVKAIEADPDGFVLDAEVPTPMPSDLKGLAKMVVTGKP